LFITAVLSFAFGIYLEATYPCPLASLFFALFVPLAFIPFLLRKSPVPAACLMILLFAVAGMLRLGMVTATVAPVVPDGEWQLFEGLVIDSSPATKIIKITGAGDQAGLKAIYRTDGVLGINDRVKVFGRLKEVSLTFNNPSLLNWKWIKRLEGVWYEIKGALISTSPGTNYVHRWRSFLAKRIEASGAGYPGVIKALTIGDTSGLDEATKTLFMKTGTSHILAISGSNIGIVTAFFFFLTRLVIRRSTRLAQRGDDIRFAALLSIPFALFFMVTAGSSIPTIRAAIMITVFMIALFFERGKNALNTIALSALIILLIFPHSLFSPSFQLTFASIIFIVICVERLNPLLHAGNAAVRWLVSSVLMTVAATAGTLPIVAYHFFGVNPLSVIHNIIAVPPMCILAMPISLLGLILPWGEYLLRLSGDILALTIYVLERMNVGYIYPIIRPTLFECVLYFSLILSLLYIRVRTVSAGLILALLPLSLAYGAYAYEKRFNNKSLCIDFIDVGLGDAILVEAPQGIRILIDGGGQLRGSWDVGKSIIAPILLSRKIMTLDYVINTHPHGDHVGGLTHVVKHFTIGHFVTGAYFPKEDRFIDLLALLRERGIPVEIWKRGAKLILKDDVRIDTLNPGRGESVENTNNASLVLKLSHKNTSFLLTGDIDKEIEERLIRSDESLRSDVLKIPHHGSRFSSSPAFVEAVKPDLAVLSVGKGIKGLPGDDALRVYKILSVPVLRTDRSGLIEVCSNGKKITCKTFIPEH
jgi:competence protein ComEC